VGLGIQCAMAFQELRGVDYGGVVKVAKLKAHLRQMIASDAMAVAELKTLNLDDVLDRVASDKKHGADFYALILIAPDGSVVLERLPKAAETLKQVRQAIEKVLESWA
jgi:3-dehydroquinate synthase